MKSSLEELDNGASIGHLIGANALEYEQVGTMSETTTKLGGDISATPISDVVSYPYGVVDRVAASWTKRLFDVVVAILVLLLFCPLLVAIIIAIRVETGQSALVSQRRTGYRGQIFTLYRFRTQASAEVMQSVANLQATVVGQLLLALSLDELPQVWNVLKGDMSIVGPRPHEVSDDEAYVGRINRYAERFRARPGLTGLSQVSGLRGEASAVQLMRERVATDNFYIEHWSFALDLTILARTATVLRDQQV